MRFLSGRILPRLHSSANSGQRLLHPAFTGFFLFDFPSAFHLLPDISLRYVTLIGFTNPRKRNMRETEFPHKSITQYKWTVWIDWDAFSISPDASCDHKLLFLDRYSGKTCVSVDDDSEMLGLSLYTLRPSVPLRRGPDKRASAQGLDFKYTIPKRE